MQLIREPTLTLISRPQFLEPAHLPVQWRGEGTDGERLCEFAGRLCYMSHRNPADRTTEEYLANILVQGHGSVLEHANYTLLVEGVSRTLTHELVRHRAGFGYSQLSQRYVAAEDTAFVVPPAILDAPDAIGVLRRSCEQALVAYRELVALIGDDTELKRKQVREAARAVLPNCTETKIVVTANMRAWRTMLEQRISDGADAEIRRMAHHALAVLRAEVPRILRDFEVREDGTRVRHHKV